VVAVSAPRRTAGTSDAVGTSVKAGSPPTPTGRCWYYDRGGHAGDDEYTHRRTLKRYGIDEQLKDKFPDVTARERDPTPLRGVGENSLTPLAGSNTPGYGAFDARRLPQDEGQAALRLCTTDKLFPPSIAPASHGKLRPLESTQHSLSSRASLAIPPAGWTLPSGHQR